MEGMLIVTKQDRKPSHTRAMRSRLIAAAVSVATVLGLAVTGTAIAANVGTVAPEAAQSATTQASQAGTGPISGVAQGDSAQQGGVICPDRSRRDWCFGADRHGQSVGCASRHGERRQSEDKPIQLLGQQ